METPIKNLCITLLLITLSATFASAQESVMTRSRIVARDSSQMGVRACGTDICTTTQPHACVEIVNAETAWRTCISNQGRRGLVLGPTDLRRTPTSDWMRVLREAGVAEIFVPYHGLPLRLYDHETTNIRSIREVTRADAGPNGTVLALSGQDTPQLVVETNDRGIAWLCKERRSISRRGQELVLWGVQDAANYDFIIEYRLRDDGSIGFRLGATGYNNPFFPPRSTTEAHMHDVLWRIDVDLNGSGGDTAVQFTHLESASSPLLARDVEEPFNGGREGAVQWNPQTFYTIGVVDKMQNIHGNEIGYQLGVAAPGISRHYGQAAGLVRQERFTQSDFAVTTFKQAERDALFDSPQIRYLQPDQYLLGDGFLSFGVADAESIENTDVVLWHRTSAHHDPHDEDHAPGDPANLMTGITNVHWQGVDLQPHNLFDYNPLGAPSRLQCQ
jgi:Cu2+-containing amine oxidase